MIRVEELRIGNYLKCAYVDDFFKVSYKDLGIIANGNSKSRPIEISEEILLKCGFKEDRAIYTLETDNYIIELFFYDIWRFHYKEKENYGDADIYLKGYWKLHEFQNLTHSLTNEELTVNL